MKKMAALSLSMLSALALSVPLASAADGGWYVGAGAGRSIFNGNELDLEPTRLASETYDQLSLDTKSAGWKLFSGKQFNENWAVEAAYTSLGTFSYNARITSNFNALEYVEAKPECWSLSGVGILPMGNSFSLLGKAGLCHWYDYPSGHEGAYIYNLNSTGTSLTYGLGAKYDFTNNVGVRAEWERFEKVVHNRASADLYSVNFQYGF
jgi:OOP family OmpA-OmpF porin